MLCHEDTGDVRELSHLLNQPWMDPNFYDKVELQYYASVLHRNHVFELNSCSSSEYRMVGLLFGMPVGMAKLTLSSCS